MTVSRVPSQTSGEESARALAAQAQELLALAQSDRRAAEKAFAALGPERQMACATNLTGDALQEWLLLAEDCTDLVRALPPEKFHAAVRRIGAEDALSLLKAASSRQLQELLDIEWFTEGKLDRRKVRRWVEILVELGETEADEALRGLDVFAVAAYLRPLVACAQPLARLRLIFDLQQRYLLTPEMIETDDETAERFIKIIYSSDPEFFADLCELLFNTDAGFVEADLYAGREERLGRRGFPALEKAEALLLPVDLRAYNLAWSWAPAAETPTGQVQGTSARALGERLPALPRAPRAAPFILHALAWARARGDLGERTERTFIHETAELANMLLLAHSADAAQPGLKAEALAAVQVFASLGLEAVSAGKLAAAADCLLAMDMQELFRLGWTLTRSVAQAAWKVARHPRLQPTGYLSEDLAWLPEEAREAVEAAEAFMHWRAAAKGSGEDAPGGAGLTWEELCRLQAGVRQARERLRGRLAEVGAAEEEDE